jgi:hypothetical protein
MVLSCVSHIYIIVFDTPDRHHCLYISTDPLHSMAPRREKTDKVTADQGALKNLPPWLEARTKGRSLGSSLIVEYLSTEV